MGMESGESKASSCGEGRWRSGAANKPLTKGYVKDVLEAPRRTRQNANAHSARREANSTLLPVSGTSVPESNENSEEFREGVRGNASCGTSRTTTPVQVSIRGSVSELASAGATSKPSRAAANLQA